MWEIPESKRAQSSTQRIVRKKHILLHYFMGCTKRAQFHNMPAMNSVYVSKFSTQQFLHGSIFYAGALMDMDSKDRHWLWKSEWKPQDLKAGSGNRLYFKDRRKNQTYDGNNRRESLSKSLLQKKEPIFKSNKISMYGRKVSTIMFKYEK